MRFTLEAVDAYWVPRGWAKEAPILTMSRIDVPRDQAAVTAGPVAVAGVAWAPDRGISKVEVSVDGGAWQPAALAIVRLIAATTTRTGLRVRSELDENAYPAGRTVSDADMETLHLRPDAFHGEWNYALLPRLMLPQNEGPYFGAVPNARIRRAR